MTSLPVVQMELAELGERVGRLCTDPFVVSWPGPARDPAGPCAGSGRARGRHVCAVPCGARALCVGAARRQVRSGYFHTG